MNADFLSGQELADFGVEDAEIRNILIHRTAVIVDFARIEMGRNVRIDPFAVITCAGLKIGSHVHIGSGCALSGSGCVSIGDFSGLSPRCLVFSSTDDYSGESLTNPTVPAHLKDVTTADVTLGRHVIVGAGTIILPGVTIGDGACIGAASLVKGDLDEWSIYAGTPVRRFADRSRKCATMENLL
ncbi:acyltransferase [Halovulum sp. GXIMD14794]